MHTMTIGNAGHDWIRAFRLSEDGYINDYNVAHSTISLSPGIDSERRIPDEREAGYIVQHSFNNIIANYPETPYPFDGLACLC